MRQQKLEEEKLQQRKQAEEQRRKEMVMKFCLYWPVSCFLAPLAEG